MKALASGYKAVGSTATNVFGKMDVALLDALPKFVTMFENMTGKLKTYFPKSVLLDIRNAASVQQYPTSESVLFQNVVHKHRVPIWATKAAKGDKTKQTKVFALSKTVENILNQTTAAYATQKTALAALASKQVLGANTLIIAENYANFAVNKVPLTADNYATLKYAVYVSIIDIFFVDKMFEIQKIFIFKINIIFLFLYLGCYSCSIFGVENCC